MEKKIKPYSFRKYWYIPIKARIDAPPLGISLIHERSTAVVVKEKRIGIIISKEKTNKLAKNRLLAIFDFQETEIAPIAATTVTITMQSKVSEISEKTSELSSEERTLIK